MLSQLANTSFRIPRARGVRCLIAVTCALLGGARLAADGELRWPAQPPLYGAYIMATSTTQPYIVGAPAVDTDGTAYVGVGYYATGTGDIVAITSAPKEKWRFKGTGDAVEASPLIAPDGTLYVGCMDGVFYALDKNTGAKKWSVDMNAQFGGVMFVSTAAALSQDGSTLYVGVGQFDPVTSAETTGGMVALSTSGQVLWKKTLAGSVDGSAPAVGAHGTIYFGCVDGNVYALNADGSEKWHHALDTSIKYASPVIGSDGTIYIGSDGNQFIALTPDNQVKWQIPIITAGTAALGADDTVYVGNFGDGDLYALEAATGHTKWAAKAQAGSGSSPTVRADGVILFGGTDKVLRAYQQADGSVLWSRTLNNSLRAAPVISPGSDHLIYTAAGSGTLYAINGNEYDLSQYSSWPTFQHDSFHTGRAAPRVQGGQLLNLSARGPAGPGHDLIAGMGLRGANSKPVLIRAIGPTLGLFGVGNPLPDPALTVHVTNTYLPYTNDNWSDSPDAAATAAATLKVGAFALPVGSKDAAVLTNADPKLSYSTTVESVGGGSGVAMVEVYDAQPDVSEVRLVNLSTRGSVGNGEGVLIAGVVVGGTGKLRVLVRGVGPGLTQFGVANVLAQPSLSAYNKQNQLIGSNTVWTSNLTKGDLSALFSLVGAFPLSDTSTDSAMILTLDPGQYTFQVAGIGGTTGEALVEVYALPN